MTSEIHEVLRTFIKLEKEKGFSADIQKTSLRATVDVLVDECYEAEN